MTNKEINARIHSLLGIEPTYDIRCQLRIIHEDLPLEEANELYRQYVDSTSDTELANSYTVTSSRGGAYATDLNDALAAAKHIAERNDDTFVLSIEDGTWKAAYGNYWDHADHKGGNPAHCVCMSILKFCGKV